MPPGKPGNMTTMRDSFSNRERLIQKKPPEQAVFLRKLGNVERYLPAQVSKKTRPTKVRYATWERQLAADPSVIRGCKKIGAYQRFAG